MRRPHFCQAFRYLVNDRLRVYVHPCLPLESLDASASSPEELVCAPVNIPSSRHARVLRGTVRTRDGETLTAYLKEFSNRSRLQRLKSLFRGSYAWRAARADDRLRTAGFLAPELLAYGCRRLGPVKRARFTLTRGFDDHFNLDQVAASWPDLSRRTQRRILARLAREVGRLHRAGFSHGDLRPGNVMLRIGDGEEISVAFLDNERTRKYHRLASRLRIKNLVQLNMLLSPHIGARERLFFFLRYCRTAGIEKRRRLLARVRNKTLRRLRDLAVRGRIARNAIPRL